MSTDRIEWDPELPGFGIRTRSTKSVYIVQYRIGRQQRRESLGDVRRLTRTDARKIARQRFAQVELGVDPAAERAQARARSLTLGIVIARYIDAKRDVLRSNTFKAAARYFGVHWKPLHERP